MRREWICWALTCLITSTATAADGGIIDDSSATKLIRSDFQLADGAAWDGRGTLFVPDVKAEQLLVFNAAKPDDTPRARLQGSRISGAFYQLGTVYLCDNGNCRIALLPRTGPATTLAQFEDNQRPNDLVVDVRGSVYVTFTGQGVVRRVKPSGQIDVVAKGIDSPNGIALAPDGSSLYVSSYKTGEVSRIDVGGGDGPWEVVPFAQLESTDDGFRGDGMCTDRAGNVYCTGADAVTIWNAAGEQIDQLKIKGDKTRFRALALRLAEQGYVTAAIEYRLGFEARFPAAVRDCHAAVGFLRQHADQYGIAPDRIAAVGGSAGGHLVGLMAAGRLVSELHHSGLSDAASAAFDAAVIMAGPLQIATASVAERSVDRNTTSNAIRWLGKTIGEDPAIYHLADAYEKIGKEMPPTLFISGSLDNPSRNEPSRMKMRQLGHPVELVVHDGAKHGHWNQPEWIGQVTDDIVAFLRRQL